MIDIRIKLWIEDFDSLTSWEIVEKDWVKIVLADIWYDLMIKILQEKLSKLYE